MNARAFSLSVVIVLSLLTSISASDIPGGIVYSNTTAAIYYDFRTKESRSLTSDYGQAIVGHPFAVSDNGKFLVWMQNSRFFIRELPTGVPKTVPINKAVVKKISGSQLSSDSRDDVIEDLIWQGKDNIKNLAISPDGTKFAFDSMTSAVGWVCLDPGDPKAFVRLMAAGTYNNFATSDPTKEDMRFNVLPLFVKRNDLFNGIFYLGTTYNRYAPPTDNPFAPALGNVIQWPSVPMFKQSAQDLGRAPSQFDRALGHGLRGVWQKGRTINDTIYRNINIKKSAHFLTFPRTQAWENGNNKFAFIYQIDNQWGPIEIKSEKAEGLEIQIAFPSVEGLAWKPDGSLTVFSQGKVFVVISPANNMQPRLELIAEDIVGTCFSWISDTSFLFLGQDNNVYLWSRENTEKVADATGEFYYCSQSPFDNVVASNETVVSTPTPGVNGAPPFTSGKSRAKENDRFTIGSIETSWSQRMYYNISVYLKTKNLGPKCKFVIPEETDLEKITDPSRYEYQDQFEAMGKPIKIISGAPALALNEVVILNLGNDYAAIKPVLFLPTDESKVVDFHRRFIEIDYEWKFWGGVPESKEKIKTKTWQEAIIAKGWQIAEINFNEEFEIGGVKFSWNPGEKNNMPAVGKMKTNKTYYPTNGLGLRYIVPEEIKNNSDAYFGTTFIDDEDIKDPSKYNLMRSQKSTTGCSWANSNPGSNSKLSAAMMKFGENYIAVRALEIKKGKVLYQWKYWPNGPMCADEMKPMEVPVDSNSWTISEIPVSTDFEIGSIVFSWKPQPQEQKTYVMVEKSISLGYKISDFAKSKNQDLAIGMVRENRDIKYLSQYTFYENPYLGFSWSKLRAEYQKPGEEEFHSLVLKIGEEYLMIRPIDEKQGWVQFEWKHWQADPNSFAKLKVLGESPTLKAKVTPPPRIAATKPVVKKPGSLDEREWTISAKPENEEFEIGGFVFRWEKVDPRTIMKFSLAYRKKEQSNEEKIGVSSNKGAECLSDYDFKDDSSWNVPEHVRISISKMTIRHLGWGGMPSNKNFVFEPYALRLGSEYVLIAPIASKINNEGVEWTQYKWKHWPAKSLPGAELASTLQ